VNKCYDCGDWAKKRRPVVGDVNKGGSTQIIYPYVCASCWRNLALASDMAYDDKELVKTAKYEDEMRHLFAEPDCMDEYKRSIS